MSNYVNTFVEASAQAQEFKAAEVAIKSVKTFEAEILQSLIAQSWFETAINYVLRDPDEEQNILVSSLDVIWELLHKTETVMYGLRLIKCVQYRNVSYFVKKKIKDAALNFYQLGLLQQSQNPILTAALFIEVLSGQVKKIYIKTAVEIESRLCRSSIHSRLFYDKDVQGRWLSEIIKKNRDCSEIIRSDRFKQLILRDWVGPYSLEYIPLSYSSLWHLWSSPAQFFKPFVLPEASNEFFMSTKAWMTGTYLQTLTMFVFDWVAFNLAVSFQLNSIEYDKGQEHLTKPDDEIEGELFPYEKMNYAKFQMAEGYLVLKAIMMLQILINAKINNVKISWANTNLLIPLVLLLLLIPWEANQMFLFVTGRKEIDFFQWMITIWYTIFFISIANQLKSTSSFGPTVRNIQSMIKETATFAVFLFFSVIWWAHFIFATQFRRWTWSYRIEDVWQYLFNAMLGNYDYNDFYVGDVGWFAAMTFAAFLFFSAILMLNLLITLLEDVYSIVLSKVNLDLRYEQLQLINLFSVSHKYRAFPKFPAPFNLFLLPFIPFMLFEKTREKANQISIKALYVCCLMPVWIFAILWTNLLLLFPTYFYGIKTAFPTQNPRLIVKSIVLGLPKLLWLIMTDASKFIGVWMREPSIEVLTKDVFLMKNSKSESKVSLSPQNETHDDWLYKATSTAVAAQLEENFKLFRK